MISLDEFQQQLFQDVTIRADANGTFVEEEFALMMADTLEDQGEMDSFSSTPYSGKGIRVDGYGGDPRDSDGALTLLVADFEQDQRVSTLTETEMNESFKRLQNFVVRSGESRFRSDLDVSLPAAGLADLIAATWDSINKIRFILVSNRILSTRVDGKESTRIDNKLVTYSVWDLGRMFRLEVARTGREPLEVDFEGEFGGALPCLPMSLGTDQYEAYLIAIPGEQLADIYDRWGTRLLEQNVRVFLQARGNVNRGIRYTIEHEPEMFFAYNNGISATATAVKVKRTLGGLEIASISDLQIVNGGQTTASLHSARRDRKADLSDVFVQMKLSVIEPESTEEVVPKISRFANTQNRINEADFFSNHPFHLQVEGFSRRMFAPSAEGTFREQKWFYERARGQYLDARSRGTKAAQTKFELEFPRKQVFSKTDLAKFDNVWLGSPHVVSRGAQKNFAEYAKYIVKVWDDDKDRINEAWYRELIAKAIVFRDVEKLVTAQDWYQGGYRANIVAYAIAKLAYDSSGARGGVNFDRIWRTGSVPSTMKRALELSAREVHEVLISPPTGVQNVTEWAKQEACWGRVKSLRIAWPEGWLESLVSADEVQSAKRQAVKEQRVLSGIEAQMLVVNAGADFWKNVLEWGQTEQVVTSEEESFLQTAYRSGLGASIATEKQSERIVAILKRLIDQGCPFGRDLTKRL